VTSFYAPYLCSHCKNSFQAVIDVYVHRDAIAARKPPPMPCPKCKKTAEYDGELGDFVAAAEKVDPGSATPGGAQRQPLRAAMDPKGPRLERHNDVGQGDIGQGDVGQGDGNTTRLVLVGEMAASVRWRSSMDNLAPNLLVDLTRVTTVSAGGISPLVTALRSITADSIEIVGCPMPMAEALRGSPLPNLRVRSLALDGTCPKCAQPRRALIDVAEGSWERTITTTVTKAASCPKCGTALSLSRAMDDVPHRALPFGWVIGLAAGLAALGLLVMMVGLVLASVGDSLSGDVGMPEREQVSDRVQVGGDQVTAMGHGGPYATVTEAEGAARDKALGFIVSTLAREIAAKRGISAGAVEVSPTEVGKFLQALQLDGASLVVDSKIKEGEGGFEVEAKYALPRAKFDSIVSTYAEEREWSGVRLVRPFPPAPGLRVVESDVEGLEPGVRIVRIGESTLSSLQDLPSSGMVQEVVVQDADGTERQVKLQ
jgi:hypothetical protein